MMNELRDLYQDVIIDHGRRPRNFGQLQEPSCQAYGKNPLCGDQIMVYMNLKEGMIAEIQFDGQGCAICTASASLMTEHLKGKSIESARALFETFHQLLTEEGFTLTDESLGKLVILAGVAEYPARVKCATLAWHTMLNALNHNHDVATTE
jgi:nitrogen fixation NifU-like protein